MKLALVAFLAAFSAIASAAHERNPQAAWKRIAPNFSPPPELANDFGPYRSPLKFDDGTDVKTPRDWQRRRQEILAYWHGQMGQWPPVIEKPQVEWLEKVRPEGENFVRHKVRLAITPKHKTDGYVLIPDGEGRRPAVLVVFYDPETAVGLGDPKKEHRDFGYHLAKRGFVVLSIGQPSQLYYPDKENATIQPLSALAYAAANCYHVLASMPEVDPHRVGVTGHSYGGKWAMFASCLYDKFACAAWSDGGVVFDEKRPNVNYWEPWYLGYEPGKEPARKPGVPKDGNPRTGAYKRLIEDRRDLHELHALMAPRPFLVSGGSEDPSARWKALNHAVAVNKLLGYENRVAMTNRPGHGPTKESNEQMYLFLEHFLKEGRPTRG
jgi:hypothetical protein